MTTGHEQTRVNHCAVIYDEDSDFGAVDVIDTNQYQQPELLPSQRIDLNTLSHLSAKQKTKLLALLDKYSECFSEKHGLCIVEFYLYPTVGTVLIHSVKPELTE